MSKAVPSQRAFAHTMPAATASVELPGLKKAVRVAKTNRDLSQFKISGNGKLNFVKLFQAGPMERIDLVRQGLPASTAEDIAKGMRIPKDRLLTSLGLSRATVDRNARNNKPMSVDDSTRLIGMARLVGQVQAMVEESGDPAGFDAGAWLARWLEEPLPALGGKVPAQLMDTHDGQALVASMLARMQTGAYA